MVSPQENPLPGKSSLCEAYEVSLFTIFSLYTVPESTPYTNFPLYKFSPVQFHYEMLLFEMKYFGMLPCQKFEIV